VIRAWRCAWASLDTEKFDANGFNPVVIRAWRCADVQHNRDRGTELEFQSRRDPGMALRPPLDAPKEGRWAMCFNPVVIRAWRCALATIKSKRKFYNVSIPS